MASRGRKRKLKTCFNPFNLDTAHNRNKDDLRPFPEQQLWKFENADKNCHLCSTCRKKVAEYMPESSESNLCSQASSLSICSDSTSIQNDSEMQQKIIDLLGVNVNRKMLRIHSYVAAKREEIHHALETLLEPLLTTDHSTRAEVKIAEFEEVIENVKLSFSQQNDRSRKIELLSLLPDSWSYNRIVTEFKTTKALISAAQAMKNRRNSDSTTTQLNKKRRGNVSLDSLIETRVKDFYESEENARELAGKKDVKSVVEPDGTRKLEQKKLLLNNLRESFQYFKEKYPLDKISFSKFASLRPQHCVLAGSSGTHTTCVCTLHQNVKLMLDGCKFHQKFKNHPWVNEEKPTYQHLLKKLICANSTEACHHRRCTSCPNSSVVAEELRHVLENECREHFEYKLWVATDRCTIVNVQSSVDDFICTLVEKLDKLVSHDFVAKSQSRYFIKIKDELKPGELVIVADFAENYTFVVQEAAQAFHWNNDQATLFSAIIYYYENDRLSHYNFVGISNCLKHDTFSVYMYQEELLKFLKRKFAEIKKIHYFSDGAPQQFKNKKAFLNLTYHFQDFGVAAEWHFFATAHGKGPCDGLAGSVKRLASRASLQNGSRQQILTANNLFQWASTNIKNIHFIYVPSETYDKIKKMLEPRYLLLKTVKGTQRYHAILPLENDQGYANFKIISQSPDYTKIKIG